MEHEINLSGRRITIVLALITGFFVVMDLAVKLIREFLGYDFMLGLVPLFDCYEEANLPTWYSSMLLFAASALMFLVFLHRRRAESRFARHWLALSLFFLFLSADEASGLHETMGRICKRTFVQNMMPTETSSCWVIPAAFLVLVLGLLYLPLFFSLTARFKRLFFISAALYLGGCLGMEFVEVFYLANHPIDLAFHLMTTVEEAMEMSGLVVLIYTLGEQLKSEGAVWRLRIE